MTQLTTARILGYGDDVEALNRDHDRWHARLCESLGIVSHALRAGRGETLTWEEQQLAVAEESAVLSLQRLAQMHGVQP